MVLINRLPEDLVIEILSRVPAESLVRFKCVHKSWYLLIEDSKFVALQLRNHSSKYNKSSYTLMLGVRKTITNVGKEIGISLSVLKYDGKVVSFAMKDVELSNYHQSQDWYEMCNPCDGLVCLWGYGDCVIIANPGTRQYRALPKSCIPIPPLCNFYEYAMDTIALGLGIDLQTKKYKVVRIFVYQDKCYLDNAPKYEGNRVDVEVYNFGSNSWRQIGDAYDLDWQFHFLHLSIYWNGAYYWCAWKFNDERGLCSFNFTDEVFQFIEIPECIFVFPYGGDLCCYGVIEFGATPALLTHHYSETGHCFDIWNVDGFGGTWTKLLSSEPLLLMDHPIPLGPLKKDKLLLLLPNGQVASFSFVTSQVKILLPIDSDSDSGSEFTAGVVGYKSSLVSIDEEGDNN